MKATLEFDLPEDQDDFDAALSGVKWRVVVWELEAYMRAELKYQNAGPEMQKARDELNLLINDNNLVLA